MANRSSKGTRMVSAAQRNFGNVSWEKVFTTVGVAIGTRFVDNLFAFGKELLANKYLTADE